MKEMNLDPEEIIIFLDIDGVLANWTKNAIEACGLDDENPEIRKVLKTGVDIENIVGPNMWKMIDKKGEDFWTNLEMFPWALNLITSLKKETNNFAFLTSPSNNPLCASGKIKWMKKYFGPKFKDFIITPKKYLCASKNSILIDDPPKQINKFKLFKGHIFSWPNQYKLLDKEINVDEIINTLLDTIHYIKKENICQEN